MGTIVPEEKRVKDAIEWISLKKGESSLEDILKEASFKFNLTPREEEYLRRIFLDSKEQ